MFYNLLIFVLLGPKIDKSINSRPLFPFFMELIYSFFWLIYGIYKGDKILCIAYFCNYAFTVILCILLLSNIKKKIKVNVYKKNDNLINNIN